VIIGWSTLRRADWVHDRSRPHSDAVVHDRSRPHSDAVAVPGCYLHYEPPFCGELPEAMRQRDYH
jgi:hypothetical protein